MKPTLIVLILAATQTLYAQDTQWPDPVANDVLRYATAGLSHGPLLGGVTDTSVRVWLRMRTATDFVVLYGEQLSATSLRKSSATHRKQATMRPRLCCED